MEEKEPGIRCDQCHADSGIKKKSKKTFNKSESHDAEFVVTLNGATMHLCESHNLKLARTLDKSKSKYEYESRGLEK